MKKIGKVVLIILIAAAMISVVAVCLVRIAPDDVSKHEHEWTETVVQPTCEAEGTKTVECALCGEKKVESIPVVEHEYRDYALILEPTDRKSVV